MAPAKSKKPSPDGEQTPAPASAKPKPNKAAKSSSSRQIKQKATPRRPKIHRELVDPTTVHLEPGRGSSGRGSGIGGHYWHIYLVDTRVGHVYINALDEPPFGKHASIQIHINQTHRGRGIGRLAYKLACEKSGHNEVIATMRKSNLASQRAAAQAGFKVIVDQTISQLAMRWTRQRQA